MNNGTDPIAIRELESFGDLGVDLCETDDARQRQSRSEKVIDHTIVQPEGGSRVDLRGRRNGLGVPMVDPRMIMLRWACTASNVGLFVPAHGLVLQLVTRAGSGPATEQGLDRGSGRTALILRRGASLVARIRGRGAA